MKNNSLRHTRLLYYDIAQRETWNLENILVTLMFHCRVFFVRSETAHLANVNGIDKSEPLRKRQLKKKNDKN